MKTHNKLIFAFLLLTLISCSTGAITKTIEVKETLNQVVEIGNQIGNVPPGFTLIDTENKKIGLSSILGNNESAIVYFMATWCPYCAQDFNALSSVYPEFEGKFRMIVISLDLSEDNDQLSVYKKRYPKLESVNFAAGKIGVLEDYSAIRTTTKYAIKNGRIIYAGSGAFTEEYWKILLSELAKQD